MEGRPGPRPPSASGQAAGPLTGADPSSWRLRADVIRVVVHSVAMTLVTEHPAARIQAVLAALVTDDPFGRLRDLGARMDPDAAVGAALGPAVVVTGSNLVRVVAPARCDHDVDGTGSSQVLISRAPCGCLAAGATRFHPVTVLVTTTADLRTHPSDIRLPEPP